MVREEGMMSGDEEKTEPVKESSASKKGQVLMGRAHISSHNCPSFYHGSYRLDCSLIFSRLYFKTASYLYFQTDTDQRH